MRGSLDQRFVPNESGYLVDFHKVQQTSADMGILVKFLFGWLGGGMHIHVPDENIRVKTMFKYRHLYIIYGK